METKFNPRTADYAERAKKGFENQEVMRTIGCTIVDVAPGCVEFSLEFRPEFTQHNGYMHAGIISTALDTACGFAAATLAEPDTTVLSIEFKVNFLSPAVGERFRIIGKAIRSGKTISVCQSEALAVTPKGEKLVSVMTATIMILPE